MIFPDQIVKSARKTLSISINRDGVIVVHVPKKMKDQDIKRFIESKQNWLASKLSQIKNNNDKFEDIIHYNKFLICGNRYSLALADVNKAEINKGTIVLPKKIPEEKIMKHLISFYKKKAKEILNQRIAYIQSLMRITPKSIRFSNSKGRWGACTSSGAISFNWRVVMLPPVLIDYVIIHELCHLVEMNHSKRFWTLVETFISNVDAIRQEIKEYGFLLELYREG